MLLSSDLLGIIFKNLTVQELLNISLTCKRWHTVINNDTLTRQLFSILPSDIRDGLVISATKSNGYDNDIVVLSIYTDGDIGASQVWMNYFPNYPSLSGSLGKNYQLIHDKIYPEIYMRAAAKTYLDKSYRFPRPDLVENIKIRKHLANMILECKNIEEVRKMVNNLDYAQHNIFDIFHNTPRKAKIIPHMIGKDNNIDKESITDSIIAWRSYKDPDYSQDVTNFFSNYFDLVNWQGTFYEGELDQEPVNPYIAKEFNEDFVMKHPHLWFVWNWRWVSKCVAFKICNIRTLRVYFKQHKLVFPKFRVIKNDI